MERNWARYAVVLQARREGKTLREAGALVGASVEQARQMQGTAIRALRSGSVWRYGKLVQIPKEMMDLAPLTEADNCLSWRRNLTGKTKSGYKPTRVRTVPGR